MPFEMTPSRLPKHFILRAKSALGIVITETYPTAVTAVAMSMYNLLHSSPHRQEILILSNARLKAENSTLRALLEEYKSNAKLLQKHVEKSIPRHIDRKLCMKPRYSQPDAETELATGISSGKYSPWYQIYFCATCASWHIGETKLYTKAMWRADDLAKREKKKQRYDSRPGTSIDLDTGAVTIVSPSEE